MSALATSSRWWSDEFKENRHESVLRVVKQIRDKQEHWRKRDLLHAMLYRNLPMLGFSPSQYGQLQPDDGALTLNLVKAKVDTYVSMICRSRPKPMFLTSGGEWSLKKRAKGLDRWCEGKYYELDLYDEVFPLAILDTAVFDYGWVKVFIEDEDEPERAELGVERAFPWEIVIDDAEAIARRPRSMFQRKWYDRGVLREMFRDCRGEIEDCPDDGELYDWGRDLTSDQVAVTEAWHLPSKHGGKDGRRTIAIRNCTLVDERYEFDDFPFVSFHRQLPPVGIRGQSIAADLRPLQVQLNQAYQDFSDSTAMFARPKWLAPRGARVELAHIDDDIASILEYDGPTPPQAYMPVGLSPDYFQFAQDIWHKADEVVGISSFRSNGLVPSNLKSGKAIELHNDVQDGRFIVSSRLYERSSAVKLPDLMIERARKIAEKNPKYAARYQHKTWVQIVEFNDVDMKRDQYVIKCYPASALASEPGARFDQLLELFDRGAIDLDTFRELHDFPDIEDETARRNAGKHICEKLIERFRDADNPEEEGLYIAPEPLWPIAMMKSMMQLAATKAQLDDCPEANVALMREFVSACVAIEDANKPPPAVPGIPGMAPPVGGETPGGPIPAPDMGGGPIPPDAPIQ